MHRLLIAALWVHTASALAQERPSLKDVNAARLANYGAPSKLFHGKQDVKAIVEELEQLRGKKWRQADLRMRCYSTVQLLNGEKLVTAFRGLEVKDGPFGTFTYRAQDHQATVGVYVGKIAVKDGKGTMSDFKYVDGASVMPTDDEVKKLRPAAQ